MLEPTPHKNVVPFYMIRYSSVTPWSNFWPVPAACTKIYIEYMQPGCLLSGYKFSLINQSLH